MNKIQMMWNGEITLWKSFWLWGVLGSSLLHIPINYMTGAINAKKYEYLSIYYLLLFIMIAYACLVIGGTWRSSGNYSGNIIYKYITRLFIISWAINLQQFIMNVFINVQ